jgi:hypothetical protein
MKGITTNHEMNYSNKWVTGCYCFPNLPYREKVPITPEEVTEIFTEYERKG